MATDTDGTFIASRPVSGTDRRPPAGMVRLEASNGRVLTLILIGDPDRGGSVGGWMGSERMLRRDSSWWKNTPLATVSLPCLLDIDAIPGPSVEQRLEALYAMGRAGDDEQPPSLTLSGDVPMGTGPQWVWKLDDVKLGARLYRPDAPAQLRRVEVSLDLSEYVEATGVDRVTIKRTRDKGKRRRRTISALKGDTLRAIAVRHLGSSGAYKQIREWNPKLKRVDPDAPLRAGTKVVLH